MTAISGRRRQPAAFSEARLRLVGLAPGATRRSVVPDAASLTVGGD